MEVAYFSCEDLEGLIKSFFDLNGVISIEPGYINLPSPDISRDPSNFDVKAMIRGIRVFYWTTVLEYHELVDRFLDHICTQSNSNAAPGIYYVTLYQKNIAMYRYLKYSNSCEMTLYIEYIQQFNPLKPELRRPYVLETVMRAS